MYIITGGGSGLGKALALALAVHNKPVLIVGRRKELLQETAAQSPLIEFLCADISQEEGVDAVSTHVNHYPKIDGLVNSAGTIHPIIAMRDMPFDAWNNVLATNVTAPLMLSKNLYPQLIGGRVLTISSGAAHFAIKGWAAYCVSKAAVSMMTQCWQLESQEIAFASVMPGIVDTDMQALAREGECSMDESQINFYRRLHQDNILLTPESVAEFLVWLLLVVEKDTFCSKEWDIYDSSHHSAWLKEPHRIHHWE